MTGVGEQVMAIDAAVPNDHGCGPQGGSPAFSNTPAESATDLAASPIGYEAADPSLYPPLCDDGMPAERGQKGRR